MDGLDDLRARIRPLARGRQERSAQYRDRSSAETGSLSWSVQTTSNDRLRGFPASPSFGARRFDDSDDTDNVTCGSSGHDLRFAVRLRCDTTIT